MNEKSLINKYRPEDFDEVIGQDAVVRSLEKSIADRNSNGYLFTGPSGTGKTTLARLVAKALGCLPADILEVDGATETGIDDMREVLSGLMYRPLGEGSMKAVIVDEFHALSKNAVTALLKSMEEPPSWVLWFVCTTEPTKVPVAVKTRCLAYQLKEVRSTELFDFLGATEEAKDVSDDILDLCAREAHGSPRQALSNLGVCLAAKDKEEAADLLRAAGDSTEAIDLARLLLSGGSWADARDILIKLKEKSPESVRHTVRAYTTAVILNPKSKGTESAFAVLEAFSEPFHSSDGASPLVLACGKLLLS